MRNGRSKTEVGTRPHSLFAGREIAAIAGHKAEAFDAG